MTTGKNNQDILLSGLRLIEASAGTGKTHKIIELFIRLILEKELTVDQILVVTFTEAATEELRDRIRKALRAKKVELSIEDIAPENKKNILLLQNALINFDEAAIFTIHGFCFRILKEQAYESSSLFDTELITDQDHLLQETLDDFWRKNFYNLSPAFAAYALQANYSSEGFLKLFSGQLQNPLLKIIPDDTEPEINTAETPFKLAYAEASDSWHKNNEEIKTLFMTSNSLKQNIYKKESIPKWAAEFDNFFSGESPSIIFPEKLIKLTPSELEKGTKKGGTPPGHTFFYLCENLIEKSNALTAFFDRRLLSLKKDLLKNAGTTLKQKKAHHNVLYFDDLLFNVYYALDGSEGSHFAEKIRNKYRAALIDEFQDTDPIQYKIFKKLFIHKNTCLFLIGDPKQAIYSFRGADIYTYMHAAASAAANSHHTLAVNYRSNHGLVKAVNTIFSLVQAPFVFDEIAFQPVSSSAQQNNEYLAIDNQEKAPFVLWFFDRSQADRDSGKGEKKPPQPISKNLAQQRIITAEIG